MADLVGWGNLFAAPLVGWLFGLLGGWVDGSAECTWARLPRVCGLGGVRWFSVSVVVGFGLVPVG